MKREVVMESMKTTSIFALAAALFLAGGVASAQAHLTDFVGKVEIKPPAGAWTPARKGMAIAAQSLVSTGFKSKATIELDHATLYVNQLTRLTLEEIARKQDVITTGITIRAGSLAADVKTGASDYKHDFRVKSPVSTAAVRGTRILYDGAELDVNDGTAVLFNLLKQPMTVFKGEAALTGTGFNLFPSLRLRNLRFRVPLGLRRTLNLGSLDDRKSQSEDTIVIFYPVW
jgi:hypothetical protein